MSKRYAILAATLASIPVTANAQVYWKSPNYAGAPVTPGEVGVPMPGATLAEQRASVAWQMRAGLNIMALQCQFDKTLLAENLYNGVLTNHKAELDTVYKTLNGYFKRTIKAPKEAQRAFDQFGTKTYLSMTTVRGQLGFCETGSRLAKKANFVPRSAFTSFAIERLRELRNSLALAGEQQFPGYRAQDLLRPIPSLEERCWDKKGRYLCPDNFA